MMVRPSLRVANPSCAMFTLSVKKVDHQGDGLGFS